MHRFLKLMILPCMVLAASPLLAADIQAACNRLGRGINLGNALEAPKEGDWGVTLRASYFEAIKKAGFDTIRLPVRWSAHASATSPFTIDEAFAERIDWAIDQARVNKLNLVLNVHHYDEMDATPDAHLSRLVGIWKQIAERYQNQGKHLYFELFNEPHDKFVDEKWNEAIPQLLKLVRASNPTRPVIVGPPFWNAIWALDKLKLPTDDKHLILTVHYYDPFEFTHQGAPWANGSAAWKGRQWTGSEAETKALQESFDKVASWAKKHNVPVFLGEFGAYEAADIESRCRWTRSVTREAKARDFATCYWEFCSGFGAYDPKTDEWRPELKQALTE